jgi:hypothetical protein
MRKALLVLLTTSALVLGFAATANAAPKAAYKVTLTTSTTSSVAGKFITVSGKVTGPKAAGRNVAIQRQYVGGGWTTVAAAAVKKNGRFSARVETPIGGSTSFRAIKGKSSVRKAGISPTRSTKVFQWLYLSNQPGVLGSATPGGLTIAGTYYSHAFNLTDNLASLDYKTNGLCTTFSTVATYLPFGLPTDTMDVHLSKTPFTGSVVTTTVPVSSTAAKTITTSVVGAKSFVIIVDGVDPGYGAELGDPKLYCNAASLPEFDLSEHP